MIDAGACHQGDILRYERTVGAASAPLPDHRGSSFRRHEPEKTPLYQVVIEHLETLRIHTRFPIVLPERVDNGLVDLLATTRLRVVLVVHCNHAQEIDSSVETALSRLGSARTTVLNQSVLLDGVNDDADTLVELSRRLFEAGALPYYLHELDRVAGAAHFEVEASRARELIDAIRSRLPGYLVPRLVRETPGALSKTVLA